MFNPLITNTINTEKETCNLKSIRDVEEIQSIKAARSKSSMHRRREEAKATTTTMVTKTSLKKSIHTASKFIALIPSRIIRQMMANFFWSLILKICIKVQEKKKKVVVLCSRPQVRHVHVAVVQRRLRNVQKSV